MNTSSDALAPSCAKHPTFVSTHALNIIEHYYHARAKHPCFCDRLLPEEDPAVTLSLKDSIKLCLDTYRRQVDVGTHNGNLLWNDILDCEKFEAIEAIANGDKEAAVEECYDCIAVLLRVIDVLEGRQPIGKPKEGASNGKSE